MLWMVFGIQDCMKISRENNRERRELGHRQGNPNIYNLSRVESAKT